MTDKDEQIDLPLNLEVTDPGKAAVTRYYRGMGERLEAMRLAVVNLRQRGIFIYRIDIKFPSKKYPNCVVMAKALEVDGPIIAFNSDSMWVGALLGLGTRIRSGSVEWIQDQYPPDNWVEVLAELHKNTYYLE